jgi:hypothetical protein
MERRLAHKDRPDDLGVVPRPLRSLRGQTVRQPHLAHPTLAEFYPVFASESGNQPLFHHFDPLVADACAKAYDGTGHLTTVALDAPDLARDVLNGDRWPTEIKLHGDFRSRRLKNTGGELRQQDAILRDLLVGACGRSGLIVAGYSGRDDSIMDAFEVLEKTSPFPGGLFWLHRG